MTNVLEDRRRVGVALVAITRHQLVDLFKHRASIVGEPTLEIRFPAQTTESEIEVLAPPN